MDPVRLLRSFESFEILKNRDRYFTASNGASSGTVASLVVGPPLSRALNKFTFEKKVACKYPRNFYRAGRLALHWRYDYLDVLKIYIR